MFYRRIKLESLFDLPLNLSDNYIIELIVLEREKNCGELIVKTCLFLGIRSITQKTYSFVIQIRFVKHETNFCYVDILE